MIDSSDDSLENMYDSLEEGKYDDEEGEGDYDEAMSVLLVGCPKLMIR